jgi:outer membrane protein
MLVFSSVRVRLLVGSFCASALLVTLPATRATAADPAATFDQRRMEPEPSTPSDWAFTIGAGVLVEPEYEGAESYSVSPVPFISIAYGEWFELNPEGLSAKVVEIGDLRLDALVGYDLGRDEDDGDKLKGLGDIDFGVTVGGRLSYEIAGVELFTEVKKDD